MKKMAVVVCLAMLSCTVVAYADSADSTLEMVLLLRYVEDAGVSEWGMVEILQGYKEYRDMMDDLGGERADKRAELAAAIEANESGVRLAALTRELMNIDLNILRVQQSSINEAADVLGAKGAAELYLMVSDMDNAKAALLAELTGAPAAGAAVVICPVTGMVCPATGAAAAADAPVALTEESVREQVMLFLNKVAEKDVDAAMAGVAEDFEHYEFRNKAGLREFLDDAVSVGYLDDIEIKMDDAEVKIEGDKAVVYPVDVLGFFGTVTLELTGELRDGKLILTSMDAFGI